MPSGFPPGGEPSERVAWSSLRASDADRDQVMDVLRAAAGDGRLTAEEFEERLEAALSARTFGDLAALTADLVAAPAPLSPPGAQGTPAIRGLAGRYEDVLRIDQRGGSIRRGGRWAVPRRLDLRSSWCDVMLDFTDAMIMYDTLRIDLHMRGGSLVLVTKPGIVVDADDLAVRYTDIKIGESGQPSAPPILSVRLTGRMRYGWIEAR
ncbi:MAG TPA: DUF1707 domain-containing protein [Streptosporangiaceae bacterium]